MRLPKRLSDAVVFARWCQDSRVEPPAAARLLVLARKVFKAGENRANRGDEESRRRLDRAYTAFEELAAQHGFQVDYPGLWPVLVTVGGDRIHLPDVN